MKFIIASNNKKKIAEMRDILSSLGIEVITQSEAGINVQPEETGASFFENAVIKAKAACEASGLPAIADDSGIAVEALGGAPGIYSARFGGEGLTEKEQYELLLSKMEKESCRKAKYVASIVCVFPNGDILSAEGECEGEIAYAPSGSGGFGYDPIFWLKEYDRTMAEITQEEKNKISHRGKAIRLMRSELEDYLSSNGL